MRATVVTPAARHDREVGLRLGVLVERDGAPRPNRPAGAEDLAQRILDEPDGREVRTALRLADEQGPADQLQALAGSA